MLRTAEHRHIHPVTFANVIVYSYFRIDNFMPEIDWCMCKLLRSAILVVLYR